ncbi:MAG: fused MFS/spermidine synthase [Planctomycetota bacterium]|jgi:spermidine synthase
MAGSKVEADFWMNEYITGWDIYAHGITRVLDYRRTRFQEMHIVETGAYGKALVLDGKWQSCTGDEFLYHEPLVHPAMLQHGQPRRVLILGGGEGATAREVLRWSSVEHVAMVDIDGEVVEACKEHLADMHQGAFDDSRLEVIIDDALNVLDRGKQSWDVIISDLSDPIEDGPSFKLFTREYFQKTQQALAPSGVFVIQAGPVSPYEMGLHACLVSTMKSVFASTASYVTHTPTYAAPWGFVVAGAEPIDTRPDPDEIDRQLSEKTTGGLRMLDGIALLGLYHTPAHLRRRIEAEDRVYTLADPPKFFGKGIAQ